MRGFPSFVVADAEGETIRAWIGYARADEFLGHLRAAVGDPIPMHRRRSRLESSPTEADAVAIGAYHLQRMEARQAEDAFLLARELSGRGAAAYAFEIFRARSLGLYNKETDAREVIDLAAETLRAADLSVEERLFIGTVCLTAASRENRRELAIPIIRHVLDRIRVEDLDSSLGRQYQTLLIGKALLIDKNPDKALAMRRQALRVGWQDDPAQLNDFAWWCLENHVNLVEAEELARRGAELATDPASRAMILDTLAEICFARGDRQQAIAVIQKAIAEDPGNTYYHEQFVRFAGGNG